MITWNDYFKGRDLDHADELTDQIKANARRTIQCANEGLALYYAHNPSATPRPCNSGWRPPAINAAAGGAAHSKHMDALAIDLGEEQGMELALWSLRNSALLISVGILAMERPEACIKIVDGKAQYWTHWQTVSVGSGVFAFWPTTGAYSDWAKSGKPLMA